MKVTKKIIPIWEIVDGFVNNDENGVVGYNGRLNIRPKYQREFVYKEQQRDAVIDSILNKFPISVMYWHKKTDEDCYELIDGQQRTISFCDYISGNGKFIGKFSITINGNRTYFHNLTDEEKKQILNYEIEVNICEGTDKEVLNWYQRINVAGETHTNQELRNAIYTGEWLTNAKQYFSKKNCGAYDRGKDYLTGSAIRQDYLETALDWISNHNITQYMAEHQKDTNASELWNYFENIINWAQKVFPEYRREMKGIQWGHLYNAYKNIDYTNFNNIANDLMLDEDVDNKKGIYEYLFTKQEKYLHIREFSNSQKRFAYEKQRGKCIICNEHFNIDDMEADHIIPWSKGGKTTQENCQMLCKHCNGIKSNN
jgi:hypothetical protein